MTETRPLVFFAIHGRTRDTMAVSRINLDAPTQYHFSDLFMRASADLTADDLKVVALHPLHRPDASEVCEVTDFKLPPPLESAINNPPACPAFDGRTLRRVKPRGIAAVRQDDVGKPHSVYFQRLTAAAVVQPAFALLASSDLFARPKHPVLRIDATVHATWQLGTLRFRSASAMASLFDLGDHYRSATDEDVAAVLSAKRIKVSDRGELEKVLKPWHRKRIAMLHDSGMLESIKPKAVAEAGREFGVDIRVEKNGKKDSIYLPPEPGPLREVLKFLCEEYFYGVLSKRRYEANSSRPYDRRN